MGILDYAVLAILAVLVFLALRYLRRKKSCCGNCMGCSGCSYGRKEKIRTARNSSSGSEKCSTK